MRQEITRERFETLRLIIEAIRYNDFARNEFPQMPCPFCDGNATHHMPAEEWFRDHGVECYLEDIDGVEVIQRPDPVPIDLTESETSISSDEAVVDGGQDYEMTPEEIEWAVFSEAVDNAMRDHDQDGPAPAA